jgi:beta-glucosidase
MINFPEGFLWGTATCAYQIEGAVHEDGRGESIWDRFSHTPGKIRNDENGDIACDHYHRYQDDVRLMKTLGYNAYRFSIAWPRIFPQGNGPVNEKGLDFYSRLVDSLLENNITPNATLYHWDLPTALGGWEKRATPEAFAHYVDAVTRRLGDRVKTWSTLNEPWCSSLLSYQIGEHAPGLKDPALALKAAHHLLLAHGLAMPIIRANCPDGEAGIVLNLCPAQPLTGSHADYQAYRHRDGYFNRWFLDPLFGRLYPADMVADYVKIGWLPSPEPDYIQPGDLQTIAAPLDFLGINYYNRAVVAATPGKETQPGAIDFWKAPQETLTDTDWEVYPDGLYQVLTCVYHDYLPKKMYVTENGASYTDLPDKNGHIQDQRRIDFLDGHIRAMQRAIQGGVPLNGYFVWSLMDNFEWSHGYSQHFGLIHTDYATQSRIPRESAHWYGAVARRNGLG